MIRRLIGTTGQDRASSGFGPDAGAAGPTPGVRQMTERPTVGVDESAPGRPSTTSPLDKIDTLPVCVYKMP